MHFGQAVDQQFQKNAKTYTYLGLSSLVFAMHLFLHDARSEIDVVSHNSMLSCARFANRRETLSYKLSPKNI